MPVRNDHCPRAEPIVTGESIITGFCVRDAGIGQWLLTYTQCGRATFRHGRGETVCGPGEWMLVEPNTRHVYGAADKEQWQCTWAVFDAPVHWRSWLKWPVVGRGHFQLPAGETNAHVQAVSHLQRAHGLAIGGERMRAALAMNALEAALLWCDLFNPHTIHDRLDDRVRRAVEFIRLKMGSKFALDDVANAAGLSVPHLSRIVRRHLGISPGLLIERERLARARQLLDLTSMTVQAIAWEVGFENGFYFATRFKRNTGQTPTEYRRELRKQRDAST